MTLIEFSVCVDCIHIIANGECGDMDETLAHADEMYRYSPDTVFIFGGEDLGFSFAICDGCGSQLGGDRFTAYVEGE